MKPGIFPLNSEGSAESPILQLLSGPHNLTGSYSGDNSYVTNSFMGAFTVNPAPTVTATGSLYPLPIGVPLVLNVVMRTNTPGNYAIPPSGTFTVFDGNNQLSSTVTVYSGGISPGPGSTYA